MSRLPNFCSWEVARGVFIWSFLIQFCKKSPTSCKSSRSHNLTLFHGSCPSLQPHLVLSLRLSLSLFPKSLRYSEHPAWSTPHWAVCSSAPSWGISPEERLPSSPTSLKVYKLLLHAALYHGYAARFLQASCHLGAIHPTELRPASPRYLQHKSSTWDEDKGLT